MVEEGMLGTKAGLQSLIDELDDYAVNMKNTFEMLIDLKTFIANRWYSEASDTFSSSYEALNEKLAQIVDVIKAEQENLTIAAEAWAENDRRQSEQMADLCSF